ncbi:dual specificity protein phosphatase 22 isoform X3 [Cynocephalus volans]|uniref:dual specificity protein phosphatase 22 isoform X3 n=1 Tax=Cynocephalus volans TaxID=110931 RepID=UPI002FC66C94
MGNGMNKILPGLYIGNFKDARDAEQLSKNKVTHILSVHDSARPMLEGVKYLCIPAADSPSQNLTRHFKESIKFIHECRLRGEGCLVHCLAGVSRSVTLVIAYIMTVTDFGWEDALNTVRAGRSCANPNLGFQRQLQEFEKHEVHQYRQWLKEEYGESPLRDAEDAKNILVPIRRRPNAAGSGAFLPPTCLQHAPATVGDCRLPLPSRTGKGGGTPWAPCQVLKCFNICCQSCSFFTATPRIQKHWVFLRRL